MKNSGDFRKPTKSMAVRSTYRVLGPETNPNLISGRGRSAPAARERLRRFESCMNQARVPEFVRKINIRIMRHCTFLTPGQRL